MVLPGRCIYRYLSNSKCTVAAVVVSRILVWHSHAVCPTVVFLAQLNVGLAVILARLRFLACCERTIQLMVSQVFNAVS